MNADKLKSLEIDRTQKSRPQGMLWAIFIAVALVTLAAMFLARPKAGDDVRVLKNSGSKAAETSSSALTSSAAAAAATTPATNNFTAPSAHSGDVVLTVSGYIINRERIELSPRFMGVVKWIGVKKRNTRRDWHKRTVRWPVPRPTWPRRKSFLNV
jgi:hypothetical protein